MSCETFEVFAGPCRWAVLLLLLILGPFGAEGSFANEQSDYRLAPGDGVSIIVFGQTDLSGEYFVQSSGTIAFPLVGDISAAGLTEEELTTRLLERLSPDYLKNPRVTVEFTSLEPVHVLGAVRAPGRYPFVHGMTVENAIALAGGYSHLSDRSRIYLLRGEGSDSSMSSPGREMELWPGDILEVQVRD